MRLNFIATNVAGKLIVNKIQDQDQAEKAYFCY